MGLERAGFAPSICAEDDAGPFGTRCAGKPTRGNPPQPEAARLAQAGRTCPGRPRGDRRPESAPAKRRVCRRPSNAASRPGELRLRVVATPQPATAQLLAHLGLRLLKGTPAKSRMECRKPGSKSRKQLSASPCVLRTPELGDSVSRDAENLAEPDPRNPCKRDHLLYPPLQRIRANSRMARVQL